jgi:tetratricopeptide (TPR) repeat protein
LKLRLFIPVLIIAAGVWAYHNSFQGPFIYDDVGNILENPTIRRVWSIWETLSPPRRSGLTGRPIINLSLAVNYAVGGTQVWGYHALNLVIHILAGLTLFGIVRRTLLQPRLRERFGTAANGLALTTAVLWTVHPLQTEAVTFLTQRCESIMGLFYLLTLYCFIRGAASPRPRLWYGLSVTACALGMASKEVMVSAPLMVLLYDRTFVSGSFRIAWRRHGRLLGALAATWVLLGYVVTSGGVFGSASGNRFINLGREQYLLTEPGVIFQYLRLSVWPHPLCFDYYGPIATTWSSILPPALALAILLAAAVWAWKANFVWGFISAWFFLILAPTSSFLPLDSPMYEHRMYLSLAAVVAVVTVGGFELGRNLLSRQPQTLRVLEWGGTGALVLVLAILTIQRNRDYISEMTIWQDTVEKCPNNPRAHNNLGFILTEQGRVPEAIGHYEEALRIQPDYDTAHYNLGNALVQQGWVPEAIGQYEQALRIKPDFTGAHYNLGRALVRQGRVPEAIGQYEQALRIAPNFTDTGSYADIHNDLGLALVQQGRVPEAIKQYEEALRIQPDYAAAHYNLGNALVELGRLPEAIDHWMQAVRIDPDYADAQYNLGLALWQAGQLREAVGHYEQALRINPDFVEAHVNLGIAFSQMGKRQEGLAQFREALRLRPDSAEVHYSVGRALFQTGNVSEAIEQYEQVLRSNPDSVEAHCDLGLALAKLGRKPEAMQQYEQALKLRPDFTPAKRALTDLQAVQPSSQ